MHAYRILIAVGSTLALAASRGEAQPPVSQRPTITVSSFDFGTVGSRSSGDARPPRHGEAGGMHGGVTALVSAIGTGIADLVVEKLIESERFRVFERRQLDAIRQEHDLGAEGGDEITRARYVVTGSISRLGLNGRDVGGLAGGLGRAGLFGGLAAVGVKSQSTTIQVTVRVVDTRTGEIIGSFTSEGESKKRWGVTAFGLGDGRFGGTKVAETDFRETAVGEAATRAAADIAERVVAMRAARLRP